MATSWTRVDENGNPVEWAEVDGINDGNTIPSHSVLSDLGNDDHPQYLTTIRAGNLSHTIFSDIGTNTHAQIDTAITNSTNHIADATLHFTEASITHANITGVGTNTHAQIDSHIASATIHYADATSDGQQYARQDGGWSLINQPTLGTFKGSFDASIGTFPVTTTAGDWYNTTVAGTVDTETFAIGDQLIALINTPSTTVFVANWDRIPNTNITDHTLLTNVGTNTHAQIDTAITNSTNHIADATLHFTQGSISIPLSQGANDVTATATEVNLLDLAGLTAGWVLSADTATTASWKAPTGGSEVNDLTASVTWDNVPNANITEGSVTQHQAALSVTASQLSDVTSTAGELNLLDLAGLTAGWALLADTATTASWQALPAAGISDVVSDTTPQLGGDLDVNGNSIVSVTNGDINLTPNGTGKVVATSLEHPLDFETQTGTTFTAFTLDHAEQMVTMNNASANSVTIPANSSIAFPVGTKLHFCQLGAGTTTINITTDTLSVNSNFTTVLNGQSAVATALKLTSTSWVLFGNLVAA